MTTTGDELLAAICADPADDTRRLAYADYLDENGDHDRAEFIRVQVALAGLVPTECKLECKSEGPPGPIWCSTCGHDPKCCNCDLGERRWPLKSRSDELLRLHEAEWRRGPACSGEGGSQRTCPACDGTGYMGVFVMENDGWLPGSTHPRWNIPATFTRGFVSDVTCTTEWFVGGRDRPRVDVGVCAKCDGKWRTVSTPTEPNGYTTVDVDTNGRWKRCPGCNGSGRHTRSDGNAARLVLQWPVERVTFSDREPGNPGNGFSWYPMDEPYQFDRTDLRSHIPRPIYNLLEGGVPGDLGRDHWVTWWGTNDNQEVRNEVLSALSDAAVRWARKEAGLP